jgi:hypothetical protein
MGGGNKRDYWACGDAAKTVTADSRQVVNGRSVSSCATKRRGGLTGPATVMFCSRLAVKVP